MVGTPYQVRDMLRRKILYIDHSEAEITGAALISKARGILDNKRLSAWSEDKRLQVQEGIKAYQGELESTFIVNLMRHLHGDTRKIPPDRRLSDTELEQEHEGIARAWENDHLRIRYNVGFLSDCIPKIRTGDDHFDRLIDEVPRIENPKPDVAFGIYETAFSPHQQEILNNHRNNLAGPQLYDIFLVMEAKCMNEPIQEAENQCIRSGCAMVSTRRSLNQAAAQTHKAAAASDSGPGTVYPKADMDSFAFAIAVGSGHAHLFVNWALEKDSKASVEWHMHFLREYSYRKADDLNQLHHDMNNIQDWGVSIRKNTVMERCEKIRSMGVIQPKAKRQKKDVQDNAAESV